MTFKLFTTKINSYFNANKIQTHDNTITMIKIKIFQLKFPIPANQFFLIFFQAFVRSFNKLTCSPVNCLHMISRLRVQEREDSTSMYARKG